MTNAARLAVLERIAKYAKEDRAVTPRSTRLARALDELADIPATPCIVWVLRSETRDFSEVCNVFTSREAAVELVGGFGADTSKDPGNHKDTIEVSFYDRRGGVCCTISRHEVQS